ncbi:chromogranin-A isoform 2-T2 [Spinachia spinachia]
MIARGLFAWTVVASCVLSLPVTPSQLENEDVEVMKCIVEALADVLSRPHPVPVSEECLVTLKKDDRLVSVLRRHNFLKLLQDIAVRGRRERAASCAQEPTTRTSHAAEDDADGSMLEALGGPGERSILSHKESGEEKDDSAAGGGSRDAAAAQEEETKETRERDESPGSRASASVEEGSEGKAEKSDEEDHEEDPEEKRVHLEDEHMIKDKKGARSAEEREGPRIRSNEEKFVEEGEEEEEEGDKRSAYFSHSPKPDGEQEEEEEGEMKKDRHESHKRWTERGKSSRGKKKAGEPAHHSREVTEEEEEEEEKGHAQRSPEEKELRMIARGGAEERRGSEEEGSASRKPEVSDSLGRVSPALLVSAGARG